MFEIRGIEHVSGFPYTRTSFPVSSFDEYVVHLRKLLPLSKFDSPMSSSEGKKPSGKILGFAGKQVFPMINVGEQTGQEIA